MLAAGILTPTHVAPWAAHWRNGENEFSPVLNIDSNYTTAIQDFLRNDMKTILVDVCHQQAQVAQSFL